MAKFVPLQQQQQQPQAGATTGPRFVPIQTSPITAQQAGERSAQAAPGAQAFRAEGRVREVSGREKLRRAGVSLDEAPFGAQFEFGLGAPAAESPEQRVELARRTLAPGAEVQVEPTSGRVVFRLPGEQQFRVFNAPGPSLGDVTRFAPETGVLGTGIVGGVGLGAAGAAVGGPFVGGTGVVAGEAAGEGVAEFVRLMEAAERGLVDLTYNDIVERSRKRGLVAGGSALAGGAITSVLRKLLARRWGADAAVVEAMGDRPINEALAEARRVQRQAQQATGEQLPLTMGQETGVPEILRAEDAARGTRRGAEAFRPVDEAQQTVVEQIQERAFGRPVPAEEQRELGGSMLESLNERAQQRQQALSAAEGQAFGTSQPPESAIAGARRTVERGREAVFEPLRRQFDQLQQEKGIQIDLEPVRSTAKSLRDREGQSILRSISLHEQSRLLKEAENVGRVPKGEGSLGDLPIGDEGLPDWAKWLDGDASFEPKTLGEVQRALRDIRRELRRPGMADEPQKERLLRELKDSLVRARNESLDEESLVRIHQLEQGYREAAERLDRGVVGEFMAVDPATGRASMTGQQAIDSLLRSPEDASEFVRALGAVPNSQQALFEVQSGVTGLLKERFADETTGMISPQKLKTFLNNRSNLQSMRALFNDRPEVLRALPDAEKAAREFNDITRALERVRTRSERLLGVQTADPTLLAQQVLRDPSPAAAKSMENVLPQAMRETYHRALAQDIRDQHLLNSNGIPDAGKIDAFLRSERSQVAKSVLGGRFTKDLELLRDVSRLVGQRAGERPPEDLARAFTRDTPALQGMFRLIRIPLGVMTVRSRAAVASMGIAGDETRQRLIEVMADPRKLRQLSSIANLPVGSRRAEIILSRLGFGAFLEASRVTEEAEARQNENAE